MSDITEFISMIFSTRLVTLLQYFTIKCNFTYIILLFEKLNTQKYYNIPHHHYYYCYYYKPGELKYYFNIYMKKFIEHIIQK